MTGAEKEIAPRALPEDIVQPASSLLLPTVAIPDEGINFTSVVSQLERELILRCLEKTGGNKRQAARLLQLSRTTLIDKLHRLNLSDECRRPRPSDAASRQPRRARSPGSDDADARAGVASARRSSVPPWRSTSALDTASPSPSAWRGRVEKNGSPARALRPRSTARRRCRRRASRPAPPSSATPHDERRPRLAVRAPARR